MGKRNEKKLMPASQRIFNLLKRPLALVLLVMAIIYLFQKINLPFSNSFKRKPLLIANTALVITQVKNIAQLHAVQMYAEVVADSAVVTNAGIANQALKNISLFTLPLAEQKNLVLIIKGKVIGGINLKKLSEEKIYVKDDSVSIMLPAAEILEVITNPADIETFVENGKWSDDEVRAVKNAARRHLLEEAAKQQLLKQASERSKLVIEQFLRSVGFKKVNIATADR